MEFVKHTVWSKSPSLDQDMGSVQHSQWAGMIHAPPSQQRRLAFAYIVVPRITKGTMGTALVDTRHKHTTSSFLFFSSQTRFPWPVSSHSNSVPRSAWRSPYFWAIEQLRQAIQKSIISWLWWSACPLCLLNYSQSDRQNAQNLHEALASWEYRGYKKRAVLSLAGKYFLENDYIYIKARPDKWKQALSPAYDSLWLPNSCWGLCRSWLVSINAA